MNEKEYRDFYDRVGQSNGWDFSKLSEMHIRGMVTITFDLLPRGKCSYLTSKVSYRETPNSAPSTPTLLEMRYVPALRSASSMF